MGEEKKPQRIALGEAVSKGIIANETLAYFIGRTYLFAQRVGPQSCPPSPGSRMQVSGLGAAAGSWCQCAVCGAQFGLGQL